MFTTKKGNILEATETIICHQVNCRGVMGAGLANQIRRNYPQVYKAYKKYASPECLGKVQLVPINSKQCIANIFGQLNYGTKTVQTDYKAIARAFSVLNNRFPGCSVAIPYKMGCGLAGGDWNTMLKTITENSDRLNITIYTL